MIASILKAQHVPTWELHHAPSTVDGTCATRWKTYSAADLWKQAGSSGAVFLLDAGFHFLAMVQVRLLNFELWDRKLRHPFLKQHRGSFSNFFWVWPPVSHGFQEGPLRRLQQLCPTIRSGWAVGGGTQWSRFPGAVWETIGMSSERVSETPSVKMDLYKLKCLLSWRAPRKTGIKMLGVECLWHKSWAAGSEFQRRKRTW